MNNAEFILVRNDRDELFESPPRLISEGTLANKSFDQFAENGTITYGEERLNNSDAQHGETRKSSKESSKPTT